MPVSPSDAIDAHRAMADVGVADRALLRDALCVTLAKSEEEVARVEACFDTFFTRDPSALSAGGRSIAEPGEASLESLILSGDSAALSQALEAAADRSGAADIELGSQRRLLARRMLDEMGLRALDVRLGALRESASPEDRARWERLSRGREALFIDANWFMDRQARLHAAETGRRLREGLLGRQALTAVNPDDAAVMQALVRKMARRLATRYGRRRRMARVGKLDVRKTLRRGLVHGGLPFDLVWRSQTRERPKIVVLCDVSRSVASAAQFLLLFLYSLNEVVDQLDSYAFSDRLVRVDDLLEGGQVDEAIAAILAKIGFRSTDYGRALEDFMASAGARLDRHTTVIVLGDGRSNYAEPRLDLMRRIAERSRAVVWLNPEPESYWSQGDSKMAAYARHCRVAESCNTLDRLERIIEDILRAYVAR
jgi:uncharacterized protein with von Willebrand factor type A (vWA) domain